MEEITMQSPAHRLNIEVQLIIGSPLYATNIVFSANTFQIGPPPVVLVHGYNADESTWSDSFLAVLNADRGSDFVKRISYGVQGPRKPDGSFDDTPNIVGTLENKATELHSVLSALENAPDSPMQQWYCLRYDVVGHSQGGVLLRMLCRQGGYDNSARFYGPQYPRGRFRRIITIGSPHNGSVIPYYAIQMGRANSGRLDNPLYKYLPRGLATLLQSKFLPFALPPYASQIAVIDGQDVDSCAKFHLIRTVVGQYPSVINGEDELLGLNFFLTNGMTRKEVLLPFGSDGVVDFESRAAGPGTHSTTIVGENIAHAPALNGLGSFLVFGVADDDATQTRSTTVANTVVSLLDGPASAFGSFVNPQPLSASRQAAIDAIIPTSIIADFFNSISPAEPKHRSIVTAAGMTTNTYNFQAQILPGDTANGRLTWIAEVIGPISTNQTDVTVVVNTNDSRQVSVLVGPSVVGDVVLYASYNSTNGTLVLGKPKLVVSIPAGTVLSSLELRPAGVPLLLSNSLALEVRGTYTNGISSPLYVTGNPQFVFTNLTPAIVTVDTNGVVFGVGSGTGRVQVAYQGISTQATFTVLAPPAISTQPIGRVTGGGSNVILSAVATGAGLTYQWYRDGALLSGATNWTLSLTNTHRTDGGNYWLNINNPVATLVTSNAPVRVRVPQTIHPPQRLGNGQVRLQFNDHDGGSPGTLDLPFLEVQVNTNLASTNWMRFTNGFVLTNGVVQFDDAGSTNGLRRFYRVIEK